MGIADPLVLIHDKKWGWMLMRGRETFFDDDRIMRTWKTPEAAVKWAEEHLGLSPITPPEAERIAERDDRGGQMDLGI